MKITILEFAPCADSIYHMRPDADEGYQAGDGRTVTIRSGAKLRPLAINTYAGGKATNVARVMDKLLDPRDGVEIELVVFRPDSAEGRYIHDLQTEALRKVKVTPVIISGRARLCTDLTDPATDPKNRVAFNISPRAFWDSGALDVALTHMLTLSADLLVLAGNPPVDQSTGEMLIDLYSIAVRDLRPRVGVITIDTEKQTLAKSLQAAVRPDVIKINEDEYASVDDALWNDYAGELVVTSAAGSRVWEDRSTSLVRDVEACEVQTLYSTIGAGDAVHAGFSLARWVWGYGLLEAARYGHAAAAAAVSSREGTRGLAKDAVERFYAAR